MDWLQTASRLLIGGILVFGAVGKLLEFDWFVDVLRKYELAPDRWQRAMAATVVALEIVVGLVLLLGFVQPWAAFAATGLFAVFTAAVVVNLRRGRFTDCGCNGFHKGQRIGWHLVSRNVGLMGLALLTVPAGMGGLAGVSLFAGSAALASSAFWARR